MKEGNECYPMCGSFLLVNCTGYQNSRLVHKQQPADECSPWQTCGGIWKQWKWKTEMENSKTCLSKKTT